MMGLGVLIPATTSSPYAFIKNSPISLFSPSLGDLLNATPVPEVSPIFPVKIINKSNYQKPLSIY